MAYSKLLSLFKDKQTIQISVGGQNLREEITKIKEKLGEKPIKVPIELTTTATGIKALKTQIQEGLGPIAVDLTLSRGAITNLQKQIEEGLNVTLKGTGVPNPAGSSGGRKGKLSDSTLRALINEEARDVAGGKRTATRRGLVTRSARGKATVEVLQNLVGNSSSAVANRAAQSRLEEAPSRAILAAGGSVVKSIRSGASPIGANRLRSAALAQAQALEATSPVLATKLYGLVDSLDAAQRVAESRTLAPVRKVRGSNRKSSATSLVREFASDVANQRNTSVTTGGVRQSSIQRSITGLQSVSQGTSTTAVSARKTLSQLNAAPVKALLKDAGALVAGIRNGAVDPAYINTKAQLENTRNSLIAAGADPELIKKVSSALNAIDVADRKIIDKLAPKTPKVPKPPKGPIAKSDLQNRVANATRSISKGKFLPADLPALEKDIEAKLSSATDPAEVARLTGLRDKVNFAKEDLNKFTGGLRDKELTAREKADLKAKAQQDFISKTTAKFNRGQLGSVAFKGAEKAAADFEEREGLPTGSVDRSRIGQAVGPQNKLSAALNKGLGKISKGRLSFDLKRNIDDPEAANELAFASLFGGPVGAIGGAIGGGLFGRPGIFAGSAVAQVGVGAATAVFENLAKTLTDAAKAGIQFERTVSGITASFLSTSKVVDRSGTEVAPDVAFKFQSERARSLITKGRKPLGQLGLGSSQQADVLNAIAVGLGESGFANVSDDDIIKLAVPTIAQIKATNPEVLENSPRLKNSLTDLFTNTLKSNQEIAPSFRSVKGDIKKAIDSGDLELLTKTMEKFNSVVKAITGSADSAGPALDRIKASVDTLQVSFGDKLQKALIPGLQKLGKFLDDPKVLAQLERTGEEIGVVLNTLLESIILFLDGLKNLPNYFPDIVGKAIVAASSGNLGTNELFNQGVVGIGRAVQTGASAATSFVASTEQGQQEAKIKELQERNKKSKFNVISNPNLKRDLENRLRGVDSGSRFGAFESEAIGLKLKNLNGDIDDDVFKSQFGRLEQNFDDSTELSGIDTGTKSGALQANLVGLRGQLRAGNITQGVFDAQSRRAQEQFGLQNQLVGIDQTTFKGKAQSGLIGLDQAVLNGDLSKEVAEGQKGNLVTSIQGEALSAVTDFTIKMVQATDALGDFERKSKELSAQLTIAKEEFRQVGNQNELNRLSGRDKLQALARQITEGGGSVPIVQDLGIEQFFGLETEGDAKKRQVDILRKQFEIEASRNTGRFLGAQETLAGTQGERKVKDIELQQKLQPFQQQAQELGVLRDTFALGAQFDDKTRQALGLDEGFQAAKRSLEEKAGGLGLDAGSLTNQLATPMQSLDLEFRNFVGEIGNIIKTAVSAALGTEFTSP